MIIANDSDTTKKPLDAATGSAGKNAAASFGGNRGDAASKSAREAFSGERPERGERAGGDKAKGASMEVVVEHNVERAIKVLKRKLIKEGIFKELKQRRYYEKPSEKRKRKEKEALKKLRKEEARNRKNPYLG